MALCYIIVNEIIEQIFYTYLNIVVTVIICLRKKKKVTTINAGIL